MLVSYLEAWKLIESLPSFKLERSRVHTEVHKNGQKSDRLDLDEQRQISTNL